MNQLRHLSQAELGPMVRLLAGPDPLPEGVLSTFRALNPKLVRFDSGQTIFRSGDLLTRSYGVNDGWVARQHTDAAGQTQIVNLYLPGDLFIVHHGLRYMATLDSVALTDAQVALFDPREVMEAASGSPALQAALNWHTARNMNIVSEQAVTLSLRSAVRRVLHQLLEIWYRLILAGAATQNGFHMPLTQRAVGELCGLSIVSVNRALRQLREDGLIRIDNRRVSFPDVERAFAEAAFDPAYLMPFHPLPEVSTASAPAPGRTGAS